MEECLPGRSIKEKGREEEEADKDSAERRIRNEIAQEVVADIKEKASALDGVKEAAQRSVGQSIMRSWDCSQIENEEEEESWREGVHMAAQWDEEQTLEETLQRRRMEGSSLQLEVTQKVLELVVQERMLQGKGVKVFKEKKIVPGLSIEKQNIAVEEDTEEIRKWRGLSQSEMDRCWKNLAERMEEEVLDKCKVE